MYYKSVPNSEKGGNFADVIYGAPKAAERQDQMDRLLKIMLPMIWNYVDIFPFHAKKGDEQKEEALRYIPEGKDDAANIHMAEPKLFAKVWKEQKSKESGWQVVGKFEPSNRSDNEYGL